jgi:hypothetical protein
MDTDLIWAAGFIDGEGCFSAGVTPAGTVRVVLVTSQRIRDPLDDLQGMFGGTINPVVNKGNPAFIHTISGRQELATCIDGIYPYLRCKQDQAAVAREIAQHLLEHGGRGRYSTIDKEWCAMKVRLLSTLKRPWLLQPKT